MNKIKIFLAIFFFLLNNPLQNVYSVPEGFEEASQIYFDSENKVFYVKNANQEFYMIFFIFLVILITFLFFLFKFSTSTMLNSAIIVLSVVGINLVYLSVKVPTALILIDYSFGLFFFVSLIFSSLFWSREEGKNVN